VALNDRRPFESLYGLPNCDDAEEKLCQFLDAQGYPAIQVSRSSVRLLNHAARAYIETGDSSKSSFAIEKWEEALAIAGDGSEAVSYRINLGTILRTVPASVERSVQLLRDAVFQLPPDDPRVRSAILRLQKFRVQGGCLMGKGRERRNILKTDRRTLVLELGLGGNSKRNQAAWTRTEVP
jgi:hypothetical protein